MKATRGGGRPLGVGKGVRKKVESGTNEEKGKDQRGKESAGKVKGS